MLLKRQPIVRILFGSHLYGTSTPDSDRDYKSVHIPDGNDILLQRVEPSTGLTDRRQKSEGEKNKPGDVDDESYSLQRFLELCAEGQTVAIDMLFAPGHNLEVKSSWWSYLVLNRHKLLTRQSAAFVGYCRQQANKYGIKGSRVAAAKAVSEFFKTSLKELGSTAKVKDANNVDMLTLCVENEYIKVVEKPLGNPNDSKTGLYLDCCGRLVSFTSPLKQAAEIYTRIYENYGDRAKKAQNSEGVDWKALSHAVRVGTEAVELLTTGHVTFPLPNASHVLDIKQGRLPYEQVSEEIEQYLVRVEEAAKTSTLPDSVDKEFIEETVVTVHKRQIL